MVKAMPIHRLFIFLIVTFLLLAEIGPNTKLPLNYPAMF